MNVEPETAAPALRPAKRVMSPAGLSAYKACRFSFVRGFIRRICAERWQIERPRFELDAAGRGTAVYRVVTGERDLNFIIFSDVVPPHETSERIIAMRYDGVALVTQGPLDAETIETARREEPKFILSRSGPQASQQLSIDERGGEKIIHAGLDRLGDCARLGILGHEEGVDVPPSTVATGRAA